MKKIKVYLQYPWKFPDSPYYKYLIDNPPEGIEYLNVEKQEGVIINKKKFLFSNKLKKGIRFFFNIFLRSFPNSHKSPGGDYDLIHCAHCLSKNNKPWVADIEYPGQMLIRGNITGKFNRRPLLKILEDKNCKKIISWTKLMENYLVELFPEIKNKVETVYPPIPALNIKKRKHSEINLFFVGRYFFYKGGLHTLEVMDRLTKKYSNVKGIIVSDVPSEIQEKYKLNKNLKFYNLMSQEELFKKVYSVGDIFIYPGYSDSFGFAIPEVMSIGIPVVSVAISTRNEIINDGKNGFLISTEKSQNDLLQISQDFGDEAKRIIDDLVKKTEILIKDTKLRNFMSKNARKEIVEGKFSIKKTNKRLREIYEAAINKR